jgi:hypothetical protein
MTDTRRKRALDAVSAALAAITGVADLQVEDNRDAPVEHFPTVIVQDDPESVASRVTGSALKTIDFQVEVYVDAPTTAALRGAFDLVYGKVLQALENLGSPDGVISDVRHAGTSAPDQDTRDGANPSWACAMAFELDYWVADGDPYNP